MGSDVVAVHFNFFFSVYFNFLNDVIFLSLSGAY